MTLCKRVKRSTLLNPFKDQLVALGCSGIYRDDSPWRPTQLIHHPLKPRQNTARVSLWIPMQTPTVLPLNQMKNKNTYRKTAITSIIYLTTCGNLITIIEVIKFKNISCKMSAQREGCIPAPHFLVCNKSPGYTISNLSSHLTHTPHTYTYPM